MQINLEVTGIDELLKKYSAHQVAAHIRQALNRSASSGKTEISSQLREKWNVKKSVIDRKINFIPAVRSLNAIISITGEPTSLMHFGPSAVSGGIKTFAHRNKGAMPGLTQRRGGRDTGGVRVKVIKGKQATLHRAFFVIARKGGTPLVVWRSSEKKQAGKYMKGKLKAYKIITLPSMFRQSKVMLAVENKIRTQFAKEWSNQVKRFQEGKL